MRSSSILFSSSLFSESSVTKTFISDLLVRPGLDSGVMVAFVSLFAKSSDRVVVMVDSVETVLTEEVESRLL
jgi:hypothetical protein